MGGVRLAANTVFLAGRRFIRPTFEFSATWEGFRWKLAR